LSTRRFLVLAPLRVDVRLYMPYPEV